MSNDSTTIIKFEQASEQVIGGVRKVVGFVKAKSFIGIIDVLDLTANPRESRVGVVTDGIQESIETNPMLFPFKTKGILLAASKYTPLERSRYQITFTDPDTEGILDGGHNALAIGLTILENAFQNAGEVFPRGISSWGNFKDTWHQYRELVSVYQEDLRKDNDDNVTVSDLDVLIPVELLLPLDTDDDEAVAEFRGNLLDICAARNNNVQLTVGTKANQRGYFDALRNKLTAVNPDLSKRIEWKTNDGGDIKVANIVALTWIPLSLVDSVKDEDNKRVEAPVPNQLYSGKASCLTKFERFMSSRDVTISPDQDYRHELKNRQVGSALSIAAQIPELYDYIFEQFPKLYNTAGGNYGRIIAVKKLNERRKVKTALFSQKRITTLSPEGFITPLVYGLQALLTTEEKDGHKSIVWREEPMPWLEQNLPNIVKRYSNILAPWGYDPQKVGKAPQSYDQALDAFKMALSGID